MCVQCTREYNTYVCIAHVNDKFYNVQLIFINVFLVSFFFTDRSESGISTTGTSEGK